jgi:phytoene/squalene synthetase
MNHQTVPSQSLAASFTRKASKQTYYTIRWFVDRDRVADAYRAYAYFRWVDDVLDENHGSPSERFAFLHRQRSLLDACYQGQTRDDICLEESLLVDLVRHDAEKNSSLQSYLRNMMDVMAFDVGRRGRLIAGSELSDYSRLLAAAVTEAIFYFIDHDSPIPSGEDRYLAVTASHITHMLRDAYEDTEIGYFNIPREFLDLHAISPQDFETSAYQNWVRDRVQVAHRYFNAGRKYVAQCRSLRRRLVCCAYIVRFEWMLHLIERDNYRLRSDYPQRKSLAAGVWMFGAFLASAFASPWLKARPRKLAI